jgi:hypothetical protein
MGSAKPVTTTQEVMNRPKSTMGDVVSYSAEKSCPRAHDAASAFGAGARTNVSAVFQQGQSVMRTDVWNERERRSERTD